ncbi:SLAP domain-containing protein [Lactobacillus sp. ESL0679]|uniref:SLAP domain-containing protein n=1 Tax=Lactobacillus sp. ESL0679 TaxID=2983209 RepID=UPI0023F6403F|nr:SLAP domain-containing protein [Lactobacillus sp. ESL0679]MDF7682546.1 SLAP domain-containing protein [Lactobacillus sp. ESL0679]
MLGKNNFNERLRKMEMQAKQDHFSIRKLSIGAASVLLGFTFFGLNSQSVQADTLTSQPQVKEATPNTSTGNKLLTDKQVTVAKSTAPTTTRQPAEKTAKSAQKLDTYTKLSKFLRDSDAATVTASAGSVTESSKPSTANTATSATAASVKPEQKPIDNQPADITNGVAVTPTTAKPVATQPEPKPVVPAASAVDITTPGQAISTNKPVTVDSDKQPTVQDGVVAYNGLSELTSEEKQAGKVLHNYDTTSDSTVYIGNWDDYVKALANPNIHNIELINNINAPTADPNNTNDHPIATAQRQLVIESNNKDGKMPEGGYIINYKGYDSRNNSKGVNGTLDVTYRNLQLYSQTYLGLWNTVDNGMNGNFPKKITLENITYQGAQIIYAGNYTEVHIKGKVDVASVPTYVSPLDNLTYKSQENSQQVFELSHQGDSLIFEAGSQFTGTSSRDNVIEMNNGSSGTTVWKDPQGTVHQLDNESKIVLSSANGDLPAAQVTLNPRGVSAANNAAPSATGIAAAINISGNNTVGEVNIENGATLTINNTPAVNTSVKDNGSTAAIMLVSPKVNMNVQGIIDIKTNSNINTASKDNGVPTAGYLVYDGGNLTIRRGGVINIAGSQMGTYSGTLLYIGQKAYLDNGSINIHLDGDNTVDGAGTGAIILVDVSNSGSLTVDNPESLILNAANNTNPGTSIIGDSEIDITNIRQQFDFSKIIPGFPKITLPPFHVLRVKKTNGSISVVQDDKTKKLGIEVLNGKSHIDDAHIKKLTDALKGEPTVAVVLAKALGQDVPTNPAQLTPDIVNSIVAGVKTALENMKAVSFDQVFAQIITQAFSDPTNPGYNNITMLPANQKGFLDIADDDGNLGKASYHQNDDGSMTVSGKIVNFSNYAVDEPDNLFNDVMPTGTNAYVAVSVNGGNYYQDDKNQVADPYQYTDDGENGVTNDLPHTYVVMANMDAKSPKYGTFSFTLPADAYHKGDQLQIVPEANFISYDPNDPAGTHQTVGLNNGILTTEEKQDQAANTVMQAANAAVSQVQAAATADPDKSPAHQQKYIDYETAINAAANAATAKPTLADGTANPNYDAAKSVYGATDFAMINQARDTAKNSINAATNQAQAYSAIQQYLQAGKDDLAKLGLTTGFPSEKLVEQINDEIASVKADGSNKDSVETNLKNQVLNEYQTEVKNSLTSYGPSDADLSKLNLPDQAYVAAIDKLRNPDNIAQQLASTPSTGTTADFQGSQLINNNKTAIDLAAAKAQATSELNDYAQAQTAAYPDFATAISQAQNNYQTVINNETTLNNLQDAKGTNANETNRDQVTDVKNGMTAVDQVITGYKSNLKQHLHQQLTGGTEGTTTYPNLADEINDLQGYLNGTGIGTNLDILDGIKQLKQELSDATAIAANGGAIDSATTGQDTAKQNQTAQALIDDVTKRIAALNKLKAAADQAKHDAPKQTPAINEALAKAAKDVFAAANDTNGKTPIETAANQGVTAINNTVKYSQAEDAIDKAYDAAKQKIKNSGLNATDQKPYLDDLNAAYHAATDKSSKDSIFNTTNPAYIINRQNAALNKFNSAAAKAEVANYANQVKHDLGITGPNADIDQALAAANNPNSGTLDQAAANSTGNSTDIMDNATGITQAATAAKAKILAAAKRVAKQQLVDKENAVEAALDNLSTLKDPELSKAKQQAKDVISKGDGTGAQEKVDAATDESTVASAYQDGIAALNNILSQQTDADNRAQAIQAVKDKQSKAIADLAQTTGKYADLTPEHRQDLVNAVNTAAAAGITAINTAASDQVETNKNTAINNIDKVLVNATTENKNDKQDKDTAINNARNDALSDLKDAYVAAQNAVNSFPADQVSSTKKNKILAKINQDYKAAQNAINTATNKDDITSAEESGASAINADAKVAELEAAKSIAITSLNDEQAKDTKTVDDALAANKITQQQHDQMIDQINNYHDTGVNDINSDATTTTDQINKYCGTSIDAMSGVATGVNDTALANAKDQAKQDLKALANQVKQHINDLASLGSDEKNNQLAQVDAALAAAASAVDGVNSANDINTAYNEGKSNILSVQSAADLQNAQNAGKQKLDNQQTTVNNAIDALTSLDDASKAALKQSVQQAYDSALNKVNNPNPANPTQVAKDTDAGYNAMQSILDNAQGLDIVKQNDKTTLDNAAQEANDRIDQSDLTAEQKAAAHDAINQARDAAKNEIDKATTDTIAKVHAAKQTGMDNITAAENKANSKYLADLKQKADQKIDATCDTAKQDLATEFNDLTPDEQVEAKPAFDAANAAIETARTQGKQAVAASNNKQEIDMATNTAVTTVQTAETPAYLVSAQVKGKHTIKDYGDQIKGELPNPDSTDGAAAIADLVNNAIAEITTTDKTPTDVKNTVKKYQDKIDGIKATADSTHKDEIAKAKDAAYTALEHKLNGDGTNKGILDELEGLKDHLTGSQLATYEQQIKNILDTTQDNVKGDADVPSINRDRDNGLDNIQQVLNNAKLQAAKNAANKQLSQDAQNAIKQINGMPNLTNKQKQDAIGKINNAIAKDKASGSEYQINAAQDKNTIDGIVASTEQAINSIVDNASNTDFTTAQQVAKDSLAAEADKLKNRIKDDLAAKPQKLSQTQADDLTTQITNALNTAEGKIDKATSQSEINQAETAGETALATVGDNIDKDEAQQSNLEQINTAVNAAKDKVDAYLAEHSNMTEEQKQHVYNQLAAISNAVNESINHHREDDDDAIANMNQSAIDGINQLNNLMSNWDAKEQAVQKLKGHGQAAQDTVTTTNPDYATLTPTQIAAAQNAIHEAQHQGENTIFGLDTSKNKLDSAEQDGETVIDNALLPYKLLNKQNQETSALNQHAKKQLAALESLAQSPDNPEGLTPEELASYQQQIEQAQNAAAENIGQVSLPTPANMADYETGKNKVDQAETAGETAIDQIINSAKQGAKKRQEIAAVQQAAQQADQVNGVDQAAVAAIVNAATTAINATSDTTGANAPEGIKENAVAAINKLVDQAKINSSQHDTTKSLDQAKADAEAIINRSQLTTEQKAAAKEKLASLYDNAQKQLIAANKDQNGQVLPADAYQAAAKQIVAGYQKLVDRVLNENSDTSYPWFNNEATNAYNDLNGKWQGIKQGLTATEQDKYRDLINTVNDSLAKLDKTQTGHDNTIKDATETYDAGLTAFNKLQAIKDVEAAQAAANTSIAENSSLNAAQKQPYQDQINTNAQTAINNILGVTPSINDTVGNQDKIAAAAGNVMNDLNTIVNGAKDEAAGHLADAKTAVKAKLDAAYEAAKAKLGVAYKPGSELDQVHEHEVEQLNGLSLAGLNDPNTVEQAIKNINKAAVVEAATYANDQIDHLKHEDGSDYTSDEKTALKAAVNSEVTKANDDTQGTISTGTIIPDTVTTARNNAIDQIGKDYTDPDVINQILNNNEQVQVDRAKAQAQADIAAAYEAAKANLPDGADTTNLDNAYLNHKIVIGNNSAAIKEAARKAEQAIAQGAVKDAAQAAKNEIKNSKHEDGSAYTDHEQAALNNLIDSNVQAADEAIEAAQANPSRMTALQASKSKDNSIVSGALNNALNVISANGTGNSEADKEALNSDPAVLADAKAKAKQEVTAAASAANDAVDKLTNHQDGTPYTDAEKQAIKDAIQAEVAKANDDKGTIDNANSVPDVNTAKQNALDAINKIKDACTNNNGSVLDPIISANEAVQQEQKNKQAAQNAVITAADKARQDMGVAKGSDEAKAIDQAEQAALNAINQVTDDKYTNAENTGLAGIVDSEKQTAQAQLAAAENAVESAIDQDTGLSMADKAAAKQSAQAALQAAVALVNQVESTDTTGATVDAKQDELKNAYNSAKSQFTQVTTNAGNLSNIKQAAKDRLQAAHDAAIANGVAKAAADRVQTAANNMIDQAQDEAGINQAEVNGEKELAKLEVQAAADTANDKIDHLKHEDGSNYTEHEKQALKDKVKQDQTAATAAIDASETVAELGQSKNDGIKQINQDSANLETVNNILDHNKQVQLDRTLTAAKNKLQSAYNSAKNKLGKGADTTKLDAAYQTALTNLQADSLADLKQTELNGEKTIAKGAVESAYDTAAQKIAQMWPNDHSQTAKDKKQALLNAISDLLRDTNISATGTIDQANESGAISSARDTAIDMINELNSNQAKVTDIINHDQVVQLDQKCDQAIANGADQARVQQIRDETTDKIKQALQNGDHEAAQKYELAGEKEIAKLEVQAAADQAKDKIDHLTTKPDGKPYTEAEKNALKNEVIQEITQAETTGDTKIDDDQTDTSNKVNLAKQEAIAQINKLLAGDHLTAIINNSITVAKDNANQAIAVAVATANAAIDANKNWSKAEKQELKDRVKQDAEKGRAKIKTDQDIITINHDRDTTINQIKQDYTDQATIIGIIGTNSSSTPITNTLPAANKVTLMHNAYLYDENGNRANKIDLKAGSVVTAYGKQKINGTEYFVLIDKGANNQKYYLVSTNITSVHKTLTHNAYVYNKYGQRIKSRHALKKGTTIATFGSAVTIEGRKYYITGENKYVRVTNFASDSTAATKTVKPQATVAPISDKPDAPVEKKIMHNAYLYNEQGIRTTGLIFNAGSVITTTGTKSIDGEIYYGLEDGLYVKAANIDAKKLKLKHNAYIYGQYGNRKGKKVLKKSKSIKTYGSAISVHGKKYYITAKGKLVKKANFNKK